TVRCGSSRSVSRVPGAPPRTSTEAVAAGSKMIAVTPEARRASCACPTRTPVTSVMRFRGGKGILSRVPLDPLVNTFGEKIFGLHVGRWGRRYGARLEKARLLFSFGTVGDTILTTEPPSVRVSDAGGGARWRSRRIRTPAPSYINPGPSETRGARPGRKAGDQAHYAPRARGAPRSSHGPGCAAGRPIRGT